jgi:Phage integrase family
MEALFVKKDHSPLATHAGAILAGFDGIHSLMANLLYGSGLRLLECCRIRVKDVDFERNQIVIREGKGDKDRVVPLPARLKELLKVQVDAVRRLHAADRNAGHGRVWLPDSLKAKFPNADRQLAWQYLFPSSRMSVDPREPVKPGQTAVLRRHHIHENMLQLQSFRVSEFQSFRVSEFQVEVSRACFSFTDNRVSSRANSLSACGNRGPSLTLPARRCAPPFH